MHTWLTPRAAARSQDDCSLSAPCPACPPSPEPCTEPAVNPMAHFVKWCKARFLNGYRQFSVLQQDSHDGRSDTEELLRSGVATCPSPWPAGPTGGPGRPHAPKDRPPPAAAPAAPAAPAAKERTPSQERAARRERLPSPERDKEGHANRHLNFEEFECDVSVEGGVDEAGQERQEFSFTLYDFDGHGKITKDDITGLVSTIYETLGASIKVPHYGSKTIKVKLTVSPDKRSGAGCSPGHAGAAGGNPTYVNAGAQAGGAGAAGEQGDEPQSTPPPRVRFKRDLNVTIQERRPPRPPRPRARRTSSAGVRRRASAPSAPAAAAVQRDREPSEERGYAVHSCSSSCRSGGGSEGGDGEVEGTADEDDVDEEEDDEPPRRPCPQSGLSPATVAAAAATAASVASAAATAASQSPHVKKRSSSMQRQELLQIIQANMEKMAKKSCVERTGLEERRHSHSGVNPHHRHRQRQKAPPPMSVSASASPQRIYDYATTPYYVNLADKGEANAGDADTYRYVVCTPKLQPTYHNLPYRERGHNRSRSHDLTTNTHNHAHQHSHNHSHNPAAPLFRYTLLQEDNSSSVQAFNVRPAAAPAPAPSARSPAVNRRGRAAMPPTAVGHTSSPHHLKHRNREQDQARAMAQVVQWLEQEFSASLNTKTSAGVQEVLINAKSHRTKSKASAFPPAAEAASVPTAAPPAAAPNVVPAGHNAPRDEDPAPSVAGVKQHEHRHVHEHIHHHYHHYQDTPPVLV